jgi:predicted ATPase
MNYEEQLDAILKVLEAIPMDGSISVLTGKNGTGKSLIRKQLSFRSRKANGQPVVHASMELRTGMHSHLGGLGALLRDTDWSATSYSTIHTIKMAMKSVRGGYLCLDEIEIGLGEETIRGLVKWLNINLRNAVKESLGCLVITHSRFVVRNLKFDHWFNLDGYATPKEWLGRKIVPTDLEKLNKDSLELFRLVNDRSKKKR